MTALIHMEILEEIAQQYLGGPVDHNSHLPIPVAMSSGEVEYIATKTACMRESHLHMLIYDLGYLGTSEYDVTT